MPNNTKREPFRLEERCVYLMMSEPFFAAISRCIEKTAVNSIPTAGVRINPHTQQFELLYNPEFFEPLSDDERLEILRHEYYHLILEHVTGRLPANHKETGKAKLWNFATDLAINSFLKNLPKDFSIPGSKEKASCCIPGEGNFKDYPPLQSAEWYYNKLQQDENFNQEVEEIQITLNGDHSNWNNEGNEEGEGSSASQELK